MEEECAAESDSCTRFCGLRLVGETGYWCGTAHEETHCVRGQSVEKKKDACGEHIPRNQRSLEACVSRHSGFVEKGQE